MVRDKLLNLPPRIIAGDVTPEKTTFKRWVVAQEIHESAVIAIVANDNRSIVGENLLEQRRPLALKFLEVVRSTHRIEKKIAMNFKHERTPLLELDVIRERLV